MAAAYGAGCFATVLIRHQYNSECHLRPDVDVVVDRLDELVEMLETGFTKPVRT